MPHGKIHHALGLHMHQPPGNLRLLIDTNEWEANQIIQCYDRATRYAHKYIDFAKLHVGFSGILLEQLRDPNIVDRYRHHLDIPAMLNSYREASNIELIGMGYYHPIFPLIPQEDWEAQLILGREIIKDTFGRAPKGFWPPEMAFTMAMIPALVKAGYEYVVVDSVHVKTEHGPTDIYQPYTAEYQGAQIVIIPRDRDISNAQESGLSPDWFAHETEHKTTHSPHPRNSRLVTTWSDGENGGWFRQLDESAGFFGHFFAPYMEHARSGELAIQPVAISEYLKKHAPKQVAQVETGAWNVGHTSGHDFSQWNGSDAQKHALHKLHELRARYHQVAAAQPKAKSSPLLERVNSLILEAETSCFLFWGDAWLSKIYERTQQIEQSLDELMQPALVAEVAQATEEPTKPAAKPAAQAAPAPVAEPAKPAAKPAAQAAPAPVTKPAEPAAKPAAQAAPAPVAKPAEPAAKPAAQAAPAPVAKPAEPAAKPAAQAAPVPVAEPAKPAAKPAAQAAPAPVAEPAKPAAKPAAQAAPAPVAEPAKPAAKPAAQAAPVPMAEPANPAAKPAAQAAPAPVAKPAEPAAKPAASKAAAPAKKSPTKKGGTSRKK